MATITEAIRAQMILDVGDVNRSMKRATGSVRVGTRNMMGNFRLLRGSIVQVAAAMGGLLIAQRVGKFFFDTNREAQRLQASLRTVTGSADLASQAFAGIEKFAQETPFQVEEIADAFIKLQSLGLKPSERALRSYGNTASAMGKSLNQFIEAVADASTSEFERLKEFGIKARQQGDQVSFTFRGVTTTVGNNAKEINAFLTSIGENDFAGAMQEQTQTMDGVISNILDNVSSIARTLGEEGGINALITNMLVTLRDLTGALAQNKEAIALWGKAIVDSLGAAGSLLNAAKQSLDIFLFLQGGAGVSFAEQLKKAWADGQTGVEAYATAVKGTFDDGVEQINEFVEALGGTIEKTKQAGASIQRAVIKTQNWNVQVADLQISLDHVAEQLETKVRPAIPIPEAIEFHNEIAGTSRILEKVEMASQKASESIAFMVGNLIKGEKSAASIAKSLLQTGLGIASGFVPGAGIASSFFGGLFKRGSAGRIQNGPLPMARSGMEIGNIGSRTKLIGVHSNEGVANASFMDSFERKFGRGAFAMANATGQVPGGDTFNFTINGGSNNTELKKMIVDAVVDAKRKLKL